MRWLWLLPVLAAGCAPRAALQPLPAAAAPDVAVATPAWFAAATASAPACAGGGRQVHAGFERAGMAACTIDADGRITIRISPENRPINPSPWYGFVVSGAGEADVVLEYDGGRHRYAPWAAVPGQAPRRLESSRITLADDGRKARLRLPDAPVQLVMAQPPETVESVLAPFEARVRAGQLARAVAGYSHERRPIITYQHMPAGARRLVVLITRQHPPETTGPQAFARFVDQLLSETPAARRFRRDVALIIVPLANPDGFVRGHWRHNLGGVDLNRDWGPFSQPETRALGALIRAAAETRPMLALIDFHSTGSSVIYAPPRMPGDAADTMLQRISADLAGAGVRIDRAHNPGNGVLKSWARDSFGVGAITWEVGDAAQPEQTAALAVAASDALMMAVVDKQGAGEK
jgi:predicted deacylase